MSTAAGNHSPSTKNSTERSRTSRIGAFAGVAGVVSATTGGPCPFVRRRGGGARARVAGGAWDDGGVTTAERVEFRGRFGSALTWAVAALCAVALALTVAEDPRQALRLAPVLAMVVVGVRLLYARPAVVVHDGGVELRNVTRTVHLAWPAIQRVDTKYALT